MDCHQSAPMSTQGEFSPPLLGHLQKPVRSTKCELSMITFCRKMKISVLRGTVKSLQSMMATVFPAMNVGQHTAAEVPANYPPVHEPCKAVTSSSVQCGRSLQMSQNRHPKQKRCVLRSSMGSNNRILSTVGGKSPKSNRWVLKL